MKMITDYKFNRTDSPDATLTIDSMDEMDFDKQSRGKKLRVRNLIKN